MKVQFKSLRFLGFPKYRIGSDGGIWSYRCHDVEEGGKRVRKWRWRKIITTWACRRYPLVMLNHKGRKAQYLVHTLVLLSFIGPRPEGMEARHYPDRDPTNCSLDNLSWATKKTNQRDRVGHGTSCRGSQQYSTHLIEDDVVQMRSLWRSGLYKLRQLSSFFDISIAAVSAAVNYRTWRHVL